MTSWKEAEDSTRSWCVPSCVEASRTLPPITGVSANMEIGCLVDEADTLQDMTIRACVVQCVLMMDNPAMACMSLRNA
ncbi:hypothetical protein AA15669_0404 [Saccharibacter floricola DSM 15669]|uniref:Uncharacterized protein n=1 Tax=Saccharibacter floricola DSM 15669 TaxID=1123227 RepID=A0ABQ0NX34_9PROT|nr:hypothetical protein AA15669_0404 [Saccharibacter floricola DSM 15669]